MASISKIVLAIAAAAAISSAPASAQTPTYGDDLKVTLLGDPAQLTFPLPPVSTFGPNPLAPGGVAKPTIVQLPTTPFRGVFKELDNARTDMIGHIDDNQPYFQFNMRTVTPTGLQFEQQYDVSSTIPLVDQFAKSLMQPDASGVALGSGGAPGSKFYNCKTDLATRMSYCSKIGTTTARRADAMKNRRYIFGADERTPIPTGARTSIPYRHVGIVGNHCSGTLVGPRHVLTAGHCVHSGPGGDWIADLSFRPAFDKDAPAASQAPYGKFAWARATTTSAWASSGNWNSDYAIIELAQDTGLGWMSFGWHSGIASGWGMNMNGYPGSVLWGKMHHHYGALTQANADNLRYTFDMVKGTSGSGVYAYWSNTGLRRIYGVNNVQYWLSGDAKLSTDNYIAGHTAPSWNQAVRITSSKFVTLCGWINAPAALGC